MPNLLASEAMILFGCILESLDQSEFTYQEVEDSCMKLAGQTGADEYTHDAKQLLGFLMGKGLIIYEKNNKSFYVRWEADVLNYFDGSAEELGEGDEDFERESKDPLKNRRAGGETENEE